MEPLSATALIAFIKTTFDLIEKGLNEKTSAAVLRDHLSLVKDRLTLISKQAELIVGKVSQLQQEKAALEQRIVQLEADLKTYRVPEKFVEHRGALFQRKPEGGYRLQVMCPTCHTITSAVDPSMSYRCVGCGWYSAFRARQFPTILNELP